MREIVSCLAFVAIPGLGLRVVFGWAFVFN
jgi:hypothetical protein